MSKIALFLPTCRPGGLDIFEANIKRQTVKPDQIFIADSLERFGAWERIAKNLNQKLTMLHPRRNLGDIRNLAKAYNEAANISVERDCDLLISLQDYIWIPDNGIERFLYVHEKEPTALITGLTHISNDPSPDEIYDIRADYTIFKEPFTDKPSDIGWIDVRSTDIYDFQNGDIFAVYPEHWESNWAAIPVSMFRKGIRWDTEFDRGIAYENQDFAKQCNFETGCSVLLDLRNEAISLPHKKYWPQEIIDIEKYSNRWLFESKWS